MGVPPTNDGKALAIKPAENKPKLSWRERLRLIMANITVEPMLAAYIMPSTLSSLAGQNLSLEKACRVNMNYGEVICDALTRRDTQNYTVEEETVQQMVAHIAAWRTLIQSIFPTLLILFWGSWSDRHRRRKPCILIPIVGEFIGTIGLILCVYFERVPMEVSAITEVLFPSICGGWFTMLMAVFSYIADITTEEERTLRVGILNLCFSVGAPIGLAFSGVLLKQIGFYGVFSISASLYLFSLCYGLFFLPEPRSKPEKSGLETEQKSLIADFFDKQHVMDTFKVAFKSGENKRRLRVILLMVVVMVVIGPMHGEFSVMYLFTRFRFNWSEVEFSIYSTYAMITGLVGVLICVCILSHKLKLDDALVGVISSMSKILSAFIYAFATLPWHMYVSAIVEMFNGTSFIAVRSIATKLVSKTELGKVNSLIGVVEALTPMVFAPMYTTLYASTLKTLPGAFFLLGSAFTVPAVVIFFWMYNFQLGQNRMLEQKDSENPKSENGKDTNGNINTIEAIAMVSEAKAQINGIITNVIHEALEHVEHSNVEKNKSDCNAVGIDNKAYVADVDDVKLAAAQQTHF